MRQLVEGYPTGDPGTDGDQAKVAALYAGFMDESAIEAAISEINSAINKYSSKGQ